MFYNQGAADYHDYQPQEGQDQKIYLHQPHSNIAPVISLISQQPCQ